MFSNIFFLKEFGLTKMVSTWILLGLTLMSGAAKGLDEESAKEQPCFDIPNTVALDLNWVSTIETLYYPLMSRLELYRTVADLQQKDMKDIPESSLYYDSCMRWSMYSNGTIISRGFNGLTREYKTELLSPNMEMFEFFPVEGTGYSGTTYTTMTDNSTFLFTPFCTDDNQMAWGLGSIYPTLPEETLQKVMEHAVSLGFKKEQFTELRYDRCNLGTEVDTATENDKVETTRASVNPEEKFANGGFIKGGFANDRYRSGRYASKGFADRRFANRGFVDRRFATGGWQNLG